VHVVKREHESVQHVMMKVLLWALHVDSFGGDMQIERPIGDRYTPDCVSLEPGSNEPLFWGECGRVELSKVESIAQRFGRTHLLLAKWAINPVGFAAQVSRLVADGRPAPSDPTASQYGVVEVVALPDDSEARFFAPVDGDHSKGEYVVTADRAQLEWVRVWCPQPSKSR
jgi:hypothetical protein